MEKLDFNIIDGHCHVGEGVNYSLSVDDLLKQMDGAAVELAAICPSDSKIAVENLEGIDYIASAVKAHSDRFIGFASVNPWFGNRALDWLEGARQKGLKGLKLHPHLQGFLLNDAIVYRLVEKCEEIGWPIFFHTGTPITCMPFQLAHLARKYPKVVFIMGHGASTDFWNDVLHATRDVPNIYIDTSLNNPSSIARHVNELGAERIIFGSDLPQNSYEIELHKISVCGFSKDQQRKLLRDNSVGLYLDS